jgi:hypothetical protein
MFALAKPSFASGTQRSVAPGNRHLTMNVRAKPKLAEISGNALLIFDVTGMGGYKIPRLGFVRVPLWLGVS